MSLGLLRARNAHKHSHGRRRLLEHLEGTRAIVERWNAPVWMCDAALFHSCYSTEDLTVRLFSASERPLVAEAIGPRAEALVHLFCEVDREPLYVALKAGEPVRSVALRDGTSQPVTDQAIGELMYLDLANLAEQAAGPEGEPIAWMSAGRLLASFAAANGCPPPVFDEGRGMLDAESDARAVALYAEGGIARLEEAATANPWIGEPDLVRASLLREAGLEVEARAARERGVARLLQWGTPWDKRRTLERWLASE